MLMHADNGGVDHLDSGIMGTGKRVYDAAPDTSPPPANESVVASCVWAERLRQITPGCSRSQDPEDAIEDTTVVYPRNSTRLVRQHRLDSRPLIVGEFIAHGLKPLFGSLNHKRKPSTMRLARPRHRALWGKENIDRPTNLRGIGQK
jgi:hypothetical protein